MHELNQKAELYDSFFHNQINFIIMRVIYSVRFTQKKL